MAQIYALSNPKTGEIRYIGKTIKSLKTRLIQHISESKKLNTRKCQWIKSMDFDIKIELLEDIDNEWEFWEQWYIEYFKCIGCNLTNHAEGGKGGSKQTLSKDEALRRKRIRSKLWRENHPDRVKELNKHNWITTDKEQYSIRRKIWKSRSKL